MESGSLWTIMTGSKRLVIGACGFIDNPLHALCADPSDNGGKSLAVICNL